MTILFAFPGNEDLTRKIINQLRGTDVVLGEMVVRNFPDDESFVKLNTEVKDKNIIVVCSLDHPDHKAMALMFFASIARELGAKNIGIIAPYLGYMRQDKSFNDGEAVTSKIFAGFLSGYFDWLVTIDPHLHRYKSLSEIYSIPTKTLHASNSIVKWIVKNVTNPLLIGPDSESAQWICDIANKANLPYMILNKKRYSDNDVSVSVPDVEKYIKHSPVLIDDIISTGRTMIETVKHLKALKMHPPVCIGVHAIFSGNSYHDLQEAGAERVVTCNTIKHVSNEIDISNLLSEIIYSIRHP